MSTTKLKLLSEIDNASTEPDHDLESFVKERNKDYAKVIIGGKYKIMKAKVELVFIDDDHGYEEIFKHSYTSYREQVSFASHWKKIKVDEKLVNPIVAWANNKNVRAYSSVKFEPYNMYSKTCKYKEDKNVYNTWQGYAVVPKDHKINYPYLIRLIYRICEGRAEWIKYLFDWIAIGFQKPQSKVGVALCLRGGEGSGKGTLLHFLRKLWGCHGGYVSNGNQVTGNFNGHLADLCFLFADEAIFAGDKAAANAIKSLITEDIINIERKGLDAVNERNYLRVVMASNHDWMLDASADARRFCIFDLAKIPDDDSFFTEDFSITDWAKLESFEEEEYGITREECISRNTHHYIAGSSVKNWLLEEENENLPIIQAKQFYKEIHEELKNIKVQEQFLFDMLNRDVSEFIPNKNIPQTRALKDQKLHTLSGDSIAMWLLHFFDEGGEIKEWSKDGNLVETYYPESGIPSQLLNDNYISYCKASDVRGFKLINPVHFGRYLSNKGVGSHRTNKGIIRIFPPDFLQEFKKKLGIE